MLAYGYALTPLFAPSLRGGMPEEERKIVERTIPRSDALGAARHAARSEGRRWIRGARLRQYGAAKDAGGRGRLQAGARAQPEPGRRAARLQPASRRAGTHQGIACDARASAGGRAVHHQLHGRHRRDLLARRRYREGRRHAPAVPPGTHARARAGAGLGRALSRSRRRDPRNAGGQLSARNDGGRGEDSRFRARRKPPRRPPCRGSAT